MKRNKDSVSEDRVKKSDVFGISMIFFLLDRFAEIIYSALKDGLFGKIFTAYSKEQEAFEHGFLRSIFSDDSKVRIFFRNVKKYFSRAFETSVFLNKVENGCKTVISLPLRAFGNFFFTFGIYVVIIYLIKLFLPVVSVADISFLITGIAFICISIPMFFSGDNIAVAAGKSVILKALFFDVFGFKKESFRVRTDMSRIKTNILLIFGIILGVLTFVIHPIYILMGLLTLAVIALIVFSPEIGIIISLFSIPFLSFFESPAIILGVIVLITAISYFVKLIRGKRILKLEIFDLGVLAFVLIIYFSGAITSGGREGFNEALITCELMLGYFLVVNCMRTEAWIKRCIYTLLTSGTVVAIIGIFQYVLGMFPSEKWLDTEYFSDIDGRVVSLFENPNVLAMYLVLILPFALYSVVKARKKNARALAIVSAVCIAACIILTWSRAAWIASIICIVIFFMFYSKKTLRYIFLGLLFIPAASIVMPQSVTKRFLSIGDMSDSSTMYRVYTWLGTFRTIGAFPAGGIGYGPTAFQEIYPQYAYAGIEAAEHSHNLFLQITVGTGIVGLLIFLLTVFMFMQMNMEYIRDSRDQTLRTVSVACLCAVISLLVFGMFDFVWYNYRVFFMFWAIIAIACACVRIGRDDERRHSFSAISEEMYS